jgi:hypothetical protein
VDIDGDGHFDILSGSYSRLDGSMAGLFQVMYGNGDGTFRKPEPLKGTDGKPLVIRSGDDDKDEEGIKEKICTRPFAVDWDGDGHLDLIVGNLGGTFYWFKGEGKGKFSPKSEQIMANGQPLRVPGGHSDPFVIDWDGDGALGIVSGSNDGGVYWAKNRATKGKPPDLLPFRPLIKPQAPVPHDQFLTEGDLNGPGRSTRVWVADINGDGKLDLLVGDCVTLRTPAKGTTTEDYKKRLAQWTPVFEAALETLRQAGDDKAKRATAVKSIQKLYEERAELIHEERTGYVWLYLRK